jgi:hypothetical protein
VKGNTGVMIMLTVMLIMGATYKPEFGGETFRRIFMAYFTVHLLLTGPIVLKIERELSDKRFYD